MEKGIGQSKRLKLTDILVTVVIAAVFGVVYKVWGPMYNIVQPLGLHAEQLIYGMWFIAATFAFVLIRKPGVAVLAEVAAASVETFFGGEWGVTTLVYGLMQGLGAELVFAMFRYRLANVWVVSLAAIGSGVASLLVDSYYGYIESLTFWNYCLFIGLRLLGSVVIAGLFASLLAGALEKTGVTSLLRPASRADYDALT
ncbi:ECF transporter S component [Paenibacillus sp.]|uniref:ECF transporter S component n=1 Tax=Paenibacillus sp. TaxID=58172 RepID=UPI002D51E406|nr:ECF transporter S component [Paenibacillus sp.]HZG86565.1 ECF transporter S component [Paenibacillus sp.]